MRFLLGLVFCSVAALRCFGQAAGGDAPGLPKEPREVFAAAAPFYDFNDPAMKPWHLKASYQLYDEKGKRAEQGTFEYWWASPLEYRSSWSRPGAKRTDWHMPHGKFAYESTGDAIGLFEYGLKSALLAPLPGSAGLDPTRFHLENEGVAQSGGDGPCLTIVPQMAQDGKSTPPEEGPFPTYCFASQEPVLRSVYSFERVLTVFGEIAQTQGKYLAREVNFVEGKRKLLSARVDSIDLMSSSDPALTPSASSIQTIVGMSGPASHSGVEIKPEVAQGFILRKVTPDYPPEAKKARIQGEVVLSATIGTDGKIHDLRVISAPSASLAACSFLAVSHWEYKPFILNGEAVPVYTTIKATFKIGK